MSDNPSRRGSAQDSPLSDALGRLAAAHRILAAEGQSDGTLGHVSLRDPSGQGFWIKRNDIGMDEVEDERDLLLVGWDGRVLAGGGGLHSEWPIHAAPMLSDSGIVSVVHTHARSAALLSARDEGISALTSEAAYLSAHPVNSFSAPRAHIDDADSAADMLAAMGSGPALLVRNHGIVTRGASLEEATLAAIFLERAAEIQLRALGAGGAFRPASAPEAVGRAGMLGSATFLRNTFDYYARRAGPAARIRTRP